MSAVRPWLDAAVASAGPDGPGTEAREPTRAELANAVRLSLRTLERMAPGSSVEVRVPPYGAVQCVAGPRHTRGTPPNVVETTPRVWLLLATGRLSWSAALAGGSLTASGARADVSPYLPLVRVDD